MTALELAAWDAIWQRWYERGLVLGMSPNRSIARANDEMDTRYGQRPSEETQ